MNAVRPLFRHLQKVSDDVSHDAGSCHGPEPVRRLSQGQEEVTDDRVAQESAVALTYNGISHVVMMATPCNLEELGLGFSLTEGILASPDELYDLELLERHEGIEVAMTVAPQRFVELKQRRRHLTGRTGCGLCGAESLQEAVRPVTLVEPRAMPAPTAIQRTVDQLDHWQPLNAATGGVHGAAWCDPQGQILLLREDVGRHNALDKLIGALTRGGCDLSQGFVLITSRASYEMVHKASTVGIATLVAVSAPTSLAIRLAREARVNLIGFARPGRHVIYHQVLFQKS